MARKTKTKTKAVKLHDPETIRRRRKITLHLGGVVLLLGCLSWGYWRIEKYVEQDVVFPQRPPTVVMKERPAWMSDALAIEILNSIKPAGLHSAFDRQLLVDTATALKNNPWIKQVKQVRRAFGKAPGDTLEIDCDYRAPVALVHWKDFYWLIDGQGVKLPEQYTLAQLPSVMKGADNQLTLRVIEGVRMPPVEAGKTWAGDDVQAAVEMIKLLYGRPSAEDVIRVDVSNFGGRIDEREAQLILWTKYDTQVRWGRPANAKDFFVEVPAAQKLKNMDDVYATYHRADGNQPWIDIRFDRITYPSDATAQLDTRR